MDVVDQLFLSEGVYHLLGIVSYHSAVKIWRRDAAPKKKTTVSIEDVSSVNQCEGSDCDSKAEGLSSEVNLSITTSPCCSSSRSDWH